MLLVVKFRNQIHRLNPALQVDMKNIRINGVARGFAGTTRFAPCSALLGRTR